MRLNAKKYVTISCSCCGISFEKEKKEYDRQIIKRKKDKFYCSFECLNKSYLKNRKNPNFPFNLILANCKKSANCRDRNFEFDLDEFYLKELWNKQNGICPYTGIKMNLPSNTRPFDDLCAISVDRIDSSKGYTKQNIEFVCRFINWGKNGYSKEKVKEFINLMVVSHSSN